MSKSNPSDQNDPDAMFDLTPDGEEPNLENLDEQTDAEELLDRLDFAGNAAEQAPPGSATDSDELEALRQQCADVEQKLLRTTADYQNYVRRSAREIESVRHQRVVDIARALVTGLDHFDRALQVDPEQSSTEEVLQGLASIRDEVLRSLAAFGLERLDVQPGEEFDPNRHEALMHQPHDDFDAGHVIATLMPGYFVNDTPVRPTQVSVAQ